MKKVFKTFILAICLILPSLFCLTACGEKETAKVSSFSVELANTSFALVDDTITVSYGEDYRLSFSDFSVTATFDDETSKTLTASELEDFGFIFSSTIPNDEITPVGEYTLTLGHENLSETDNVIIKVKVEKKTIDVNSLNFTWTDDATDIIYDGQPQTIEITELSEYLEVVSYSGNVETAPNGCEKPNTTSSTQAELTPSFYTATATLRLKLEYQDKYVLTKSVVEHEWTIKKGTIATPTLTSVDMISYDFEPETQRTAMIKSETISELESKNISTKISGSTTGTNAGGYAVSILFTYTGEDKNYYNLKGDQKNQIGSEDITWTINKKTIYIDNLDLTLGSAYFYDDSKITYDGSKKRVYFYLSDLYNKGYLNESNSSLGILSYSETGTTATDADTYTATIEFTVNDSNYALSNTTIKKQWKINKATYKVSATASTYEFTYNGKNQDLQVAVKSDNADINTNIVSYIITGNSVKNAGDYTAIVEFTLVNKNYNLLGCDKDNRISLSWQIKKAELDVFADANQQFVYGTTQEAISTNAKLASIGEQGIDFVDNESEENKTAIYQILKDSITFEVRENDYATIAYTGKLNVGSYYLYPIIPNGLTLDNYIVEYADVVQFNITKKAITGALISKTITYGNVAKYILDDLTFIDLVAEDTKGNNNFVISKIEYKASDSNEWTGETPENAGVYSVKVDGVGDNYTFSVEGVLKINQKEIDVSGVELKVKGGDAYSNAFTYDGNQKSVVFDLSSLSSKGYTDDSTYPLEQGLPSGSSSTGSEILELFERSGTFSATNAGEYTVSIKFRISSILDYQKNYKFQDTEDSEVTITKQWKIDEQIIDTSKVILKRSDGFEYTDTILKYSGKEQTVAFDLSSLESYLDDSSGSALLTYVQSIDTGIDANTYTATITFTVNDDNYAVSDTIVSKQWKINKRDLGVIADENQQFVYGTTQEAISTNAKLASIGEYGIDFVYNESEENKTKFYQILKDSITFEVRVDDYAKTAYTGKLNVGSYYLYPIIPNGLTFDNYEVTSGGCVRFTITKANLTLTVNDKTNQSDDYDFDDMHALIYDGNAKAYTINDVTATGFANGDTLESLGLSFEYAKREFEVIDSVLSFTDSDDNLTWTSTAPIDAGAYQVRVVVNNKNYNITSNTGKMLIMKKVL